MNESGNWLYPEIPVLSLLRAKPLAQEILDRLELDPWADPRIPAGDLCASKGIRWSDMEAALRNLPDSRAERDWEAESLPLLLDHLVSEHADILGRTVPALRIAITRAAALSPSPNRFSYLAQAWPGFNTLLAAHMKEEEVFLFPKLLHYDFCVRHRGQHPDFSSGSVNVFIALHLLGNENRQMDALNLFVAGWDAEHQTEPNPSVLELELRRLLEDFKNRLNGHNALEAAVLFPRAKLLEKALYDAAIAGWANPSRTVSSSR